MARKKTKKRNEKTFGKLGVLTAAVLLSLLIVRAHRQAHLSFVSENIAQNNSKSSPPTFLYAPTLSLGIPVEEAAIQSGVWKFNDESASHLSASANPGDRESVIIYGPNSEAVFGKILSLKKEDPIIITSFNGSTRSYIVREIKIVRPNERGVFSNKSEELVLFTSIGVGSGKRFVVSASPAIGQL